jgi:hypothetical protein
MSIGGSRLRRSTMATRRPTVCRPGVPRRRSNSAASNSTFSKSCANGFSPMN